VVCIADEVYEMNVFPEYEHFRMASLPGMWERTITVGSSGKAFRSEFIFNFLSEGKF
jgi:aspartate/methionine/tyrosine aminotransferase